MSALALCLALPLPALAEVSAATLKSLAAPDSLDTSIGTLTFKDGAPDAPSARKVYDAMDFSNALAVYNNSFRGASAYAIRKGFHDIGADDNTVVIFSDLMDAKSLFLTANADTIYYLSAVDLSKGPMVIEQPSKGLGTINDMWFSWVIDVGFPGPDRGQGGKYLIVPPGYDGPLPDGGYFVAHARTDRILYAARAFLTDNDPRPTVENIKANLKIYPYTPPAATARASRPPWKARSASPPIRRFPRPGSSRRPGWHSTPSPRATTASSRRSTPTCRTSRPPATTWSSPVSSRPSASSRARRSRPTSA